MADTQTKQADAKETTFPIRLVKQETGETHWNVAKGVWEPVTHGETGEPSAEYVLLATIDGVDVKIGSYNAGRVETIIRAQKQAQNSLATGLNTPSAPESVGLNISSRKRKGGPG